LAFYIPPGIGNPIHTCHWNLEIASPHICNAATFIELIIQSQVPSFDTIVNANFYNNSGAGAFTKYYTAERPDCMNFDNEDLPFEFHFGGNRQCEFSGATVGVTTL
jgi:hypothetical protein